MTTIYHVWSDYDRTDAEEVRIHNLARSSWNAMPGRVDVSIHDSKLRRNGKNFGALRPVPFVKDLIDLAEGDASFANYIILLTNSDTILSFDADREIRGYFRVSITGQSVWVSRRDFKRIDHLIPDAMIQTGEPHIGADVFAMTVQWWKDHRDKFPDMLYGYEGWDLCLRELIKSTGGMEIPNICYHQKHQSHWATPETRESAGNLYNRKLMIEFFNT